MKRKRNCCIQNKAGFTLVELLIGMTIVVMLAMMMVGVFNAIGVTNKGRDAQRKKDLRVIKIAFEEYFNDHGYFPNDVNVWNVRENCRSNIFSPYLRSWPCDLNREPYKILVGENKFRVMANLENKEDKEVPVGWYGRTDFMLYGWDTSDVNYGVSSSNILWYDIDGEIDSNCNISQCLSNISGICSDVTAVTRSNPCGGSFCYFYDDNFPGTCTNRCKTTCCGVGCILD